MDIYWPTQHEEILEIETVTLPAILTELLHKTFLKIRAYIATKEHLNFTKFKKANYDCYTIFYYLLD